MDTLYLRGVKEERYVKALAEFTANAPPSIDADLYPEYLLHPRPFLPRPWLTSGRKTIDPEREFPRRGQVQLPHEAFARDSGYAFYISSLMAGEGDPGRLTEDPIHNTPQGSQIKSMALQLAHQMKFGRLDFSFKVIETLRGPVWFFPLQTHDTEA
jgi:hypothetical protein